MVDKDQALQTGNELFEAFFEQIKLALDHLYDFAYLQRHPLARRYDGENDLSAKTAGRQLRHELIAAIESLKPYSEGHFRAPDARLYNLLHLMYVESVTIQEAAAELKALIRQDTPTTIACGSLRTPSIFPIAISSRSSPIARRRTFPSGRVSLMVGRS